MCSALLTPPRAAPFGDARRRRKVRALRPRGQAVFNPSAGAPQPDPPIGFECARISPEENILGDPYGELALRPAFAARLAASHDVIRSGHREMVVTIGAKQPVYFSLL